MRLIDADALQAEYKKYNKGKRLLLIDTAPTIVPDRKRGRWLEKKVVHARNDERIAEWQSCKCSECGRYDTRPYMYYFDEPNFCSWCGASMQEDES